MATAKYHRLAQRLREQIRSGTLPPGGRLPTFTELNRLYQVTQATIESALSLLEEENLIERRHRSGVYVSERVHGGGALSSRMRRGLLIVTEVSLDIAEQAHHVSGMSAAVVFKALAASQRQHLSTTLVHPASLTAEDVAACVAFPPAGIIAILGAQPTPPLPFLDALLRLPVPRAGWSSLGFPLGMPLVEHDHAAGAAELTRWLLARGRKRILQVRPPDGGGAWMDERRRGHCAALAQAAVKIVPLGCPTLPAGPAYLATEAEFMAYARVVCGYLVEFLAHRQQPVDAIMAPTDGFVPVLARACRLCGLTPNVDVLIVGYDAYWEHVPERRFEDLMPLATIDKQNAEAGEALVRLILSQAAQPQFPPVNVLTPPQMVIP